MIMAQQFFQIINNPLKIAQTGSNIIEVERTWIGYILNWVRLVGTGLAVIMITYMALRYINVGPDKKSEMKGRLGSFVIGAVILVGASNIIYYVERLMEDIFVNVVGL